MVLGGGSEKSDIQKRNIKKVKIRGERFGGWTGLFDIANRKITRK